MIANVLAETIVKRIVADLEGRKGLGDEWHMVDEDVVQSIVEEWEAIAVGVLGGVPR